MLGWVIIAEIKCSDETFMFAPDVQGPISNRATELIRAARPDVLMVGGPPLYLRGFKADEKQLQQGLKNLMSLAETVPLLIIEHHILRDAEWHDKIRQVYEAANKTGNIINTAAEFIGQDNVFLEARRTQLYEEMPPSKDFERWMRETSEAKSVKKPPV
jgi:predicted metallo-beta-lactamase superfamily hydrolase